MELVATCSVEDVTKLLSGVELGLRLSDSLLPVLVGPSEDVDDTGLLASDVLAPEVERVSLVVLSSRPDEELDPVSLD